MVFDRIEYLVGPNVSDFAKPIDWLDFDRFKDSPELRATFYAAIYRIVNDGAHHLALALLMEVVQDKSVALQVERAMRQWLAGKHVFSVDGVETVLTITAIRAKIPQPVATWFDWGMDTKGQWVKGKEALDVLVVEDGGTPPD